MVITVIEYSKKTQGDNKLSEHFRVREFSSEDGSDKILIDSDLIAFLESLREYLKCSKIDINSGYRTESHNKSVGGSSTSKHVMGKAADILCFSKNGGLIGSKLVCCAVQDLNHNGGCARINDNATHIDTRGERSWFDETTSPYTYTNDFYSYFGIYKKNPYPTPTSVLHYGVKNDNVKWLQYDLNSRGYKISIDGSFGPATEDAVKAFQKSQGLAVDGHVGPATRKALGI